MTLSVFFIVSYALLWAGMVSLALVVVGMLRHLGLMTARLQGGPSHRPVAAPTLEHDGPSLGERLPRLGVGADVQTYESECRPRTLVAVLSSTCQSCRDVVGPLQSMHREGLKTLRVVAVMRGDEVACENFRSVYPIEFPFICDATSRLCKRLNVHRIPFGLLYDESGFLVRKAELTEPAVVRALVRGGGETEDVMRHVISLAEPA